MPDIAPDNADVSTAESPSETGPRGPVTGASERLLAAVSAFDDAALREPSLLPGWSRGHVVTHVARNADSLTNLLTWARTGEPTYQYATSTGRAADIEAGAGRPATELVADLQDAVARFAQAVVDLPDDAWSFEVRKGPGGSGETIPVRRVMWMRMLEVEIHHVDLRTGYSPADWPDEFVARAIGETVSTYRRRDDVAPMTLDIGGHLEMIRSGGPTIAGAATDVLAWLIGRSDGSALQSDRPLPDLPPWK